MNGNDQAEANELLRELRLLGETMAGAEGNPKIRQITVSEVSTFGVLILKAVARVEKLLKNGHSPSSR